MQKNNLFRSLFLFILSLILTYITAQNSNFTTGQIITIGKDGYYVIDANQSITEGLENGTYTDTVTYKGLPISVAKEEDGLEDNALWEIVDGINQSNQNVQFLKNVATGNYLGMYLEWSPQRYHDIRVYQDDQNGEIHIAPISCKYAPYELSQTTIYNGGQITIWTLFNANQWIHFSLEYKDGKWQVIVLDWSATYNAAINSIGTTKPEIFNPIEETTTTYELVGIQSSYPVAGGGGIFNMMSDVVVNKIDGTYYQSNTGTKVYTNKKITELNVKSVTLTETNTKINGQIINNNEITFLENTTTETRYSIINAEYSFEEKTETKTLNTSIEFTQVPKIDISKLNFLHKNNNIQPVHSDTRIIYAIPNQKRHLALPLEGNPNYKKGFYRWYNYETDGTVKALLFGSAHWEKFANNKGTFLYEGDHLDTNSPDGTYYMFTGNPIKVAVDISQYTDFDISNNNFTEPTLSNRVIYDIRNASEIANKLDATNQQLPLEHYTYYAPCNKTIHIGPAYKWTGNDCNYFINNGGEFPISIAKTACWTKNEEDFSVSEIYDDRLIPITTPSSLTTPDEYILYANKEKTKVIAHFHVYASPQDNIGPKLETEGGLYTNAELNKYYKLIDSIDFNNIEINTPLDWDQSTYGFYYNDIDRANGLGGGLIDGEYGLLRTRNNLTNRDWVDKNGQTQSSGSFVYVRTNQYPGKIADLKIEDGENLCPGAPVFISAWVANVGEIGTTPHASLRFVIYGVNEDGHKTNLMTYVTGEIPTGGWAQILFQIQLGQIFYDEYHVHIENNGHTTSNDFAIDDIRMYTTKPLLSGISGLSACDMTKEKNVAALRVDYCQLTNLYGNDSLYYQWHNGKADNLGSVLDLNYINKTKGTRLQPCGAIEIIDEFIPSDNNEPNYTKETIIAQKGEDKYYPSIEAFLYSNDASNNGADGVHEIYTIEDGHIILYIVHSSGLFQEGNYYTAQIMQRVPDFSHDVSCGAYYTYEVRPRTALMVDGIVYDDAILKNLSLNGEHTLGIQVYGFDSNGNIVKSTCNADWIEYNANIDDDILIALRNFRYEYPEATTLSAVKGNFTQNDYNLLNPLINDNILKLNQNTIKIKINEGILNYVAIPVIATSFSSEFMACDNPLYITLGAEITMSYVKTDAITGDPIYYDDYIDLGIEDLQGSPLVMRIPYSKVESELNSLSFEIDYLGEGFDSLESKEVVLCTADHNGPTVYEIQGELNEINPLSQFQILTLNKVNDNFKFEAGHSYVFHCKGYENDAKVNPGTFIVHIVPDIVIWKPKHAGLSTAWHNDDNWASIESYNNPYATTRGFIPTSETNVIIPELVNTIYAPLLSSTSSNLEEGSNKHLRYEYGIEFNTCKNIYFDENAALANHHKLTYNNVFVDMHFEHNNGTFELKSVPLNDVYSGDFYIPKEGDETTTGNIETFNFGTPATVNTRVANKFVQKTFNASVTQHTGTEQNVVKSETSTWSEPTNALNMPWQVGRGYAIAKQTTTNQNYVRLPKTDTEYCFYYNNNGQEGEIPFTKTSISRTSNATKFAFDKNITIKLKNDAPGKIFLIGNPFMCNLSVNKLYSSLQNTIENNFYYTYKDGILQAEFISLNSETYIEPMEAIFVMTKSETTTLSIPFRTTMMYYRDYQDNVAQASTRRTKEFNEILTITAKRNDKISKTNIKLSSNATTQYSVGEDVPLLLLDPELTPFAIYSIVDSQAVAYNTVDDIYMIPLSINVIDGEEMGDITFEFSGVDNLSQFVYLYDSYEDRYISLAEGDILNYDVDENQAVRYYITSHRVGDVITELDQSLLETVKILNIGEGQLMIYASENITSLNVYDLTGNLIISKQNINAPQQYITLPQYNIYMFEIITESIVSNQKVATK